MQTICGIREERDKHLTGRDGRIKLSKVITADKQGGQTRKKTIYRAIGDRFLLI